jgi:hypothetical protein
MYERFTAGAKENESRYVFHRDMQQVMWDGEIEAINITAAPTAWKQFTSPQYVSLDVTYFTRNLGKFTETIRLPVVNENNQWRIPWRPQYFIPEFANGDTLKTTIVPGRRGTIRDHDGNILAQDFLSSMIWVTPKLVDTTKETEMISYLENIFGGLPRFSAVNFYHRYAVNSQPDWPVALGVIPTQDNTISTTLKTYRGITLTPAIGRLESSDSGLVINTQYAECCSYLYTTSTYDGISGPEKQYDEKLKGQNGGTLEILDTTGKPVQTLMNKEKKDGVDVSL